MKKLIAILLTVAMVMSLCAFTASAADVTEISLWTYPIGKWGDEAAVNEILAAFNEAHPEIKVTVEYLTYESGDDKLNTAIEGGRAPDLIFEGPERLIANYAARGLLMDLTDVKGEGFYESVINTCSIDGKLYAMPISQTAHCMAINYEAFQEADALQYINEDTHTWKSVDDYFKAIQAVYENTGMDVSIVYCGGQGGDQGTRHLISNIAGGTPWSNAEHTQYTFATEANAEALAKLYAQDGITFDPSSQGGDEINLFVQGILKIANCWNITLANNNKDALSFRAFPMAFPCDNTPVLAGGFYCFGVFDNKDADRAAAAKEFIKWITTDDDAYSKAVLAAGQWPTRDLPGLYDGNEQMTEYGLLAPLMGDYYQITLGWAPTRTAMWGMLQRVGAGDGSVESILAELNVAQDAANAAAAEAAAAK